MMYTIVFFNGTVKHISEKRYRVFAPQLESCDSIALGTEYIAKKSIARIVPFKEWQNEEEQKLIQKGKEIYICDFGQFHEAHESSNPCSCVREKREPCTERAAKMIEKPRAMIATPHYVPNDPE